MPDLEDDSLKIAKYLYENKYTGGNSTVVSELKEAVALSPEDFDPADDYLMQAKYCDGTWGGDDAQRSLTPLGVQFVKSRLTQTETAKSRWSKVFTVLGILIAVIAIAVSLFVPEVRKWLGLE